MMAMESSNTRNASELNNNNEPSPSQPINFRETRNPTNTSVSVGANPGAISETSVVMVVSNTLSSKKCENPTSSTADRGISESIILWATAAVSSRPWLRKKKSRSTRPAKRTILGKRLSIGRHFEWGQRAMQTQIR